MDRYQGKNLNQYQEDIRRAAAKGVKDLNLSGGTTSSTNISPGFHSSSSQPAIGRSLPQKLSSSSISSTSNGNGKAQARTKSPIIIDNGPSSISVSAAAARIEHLQRVNQLNISNGNTSRLQPASTMPASRGENCSLADVGISGRRQSAGPVAANALLATKEQNVTRFVSKSSSASSILQQGTNGSRLVRTLVHQPTSNSTSSMPQAAAGGVIADFAFGNNKTTGSGGGGGGGGENVMNVTAQRQSPLTTLNNNNNVGSATNSIDQNTLPQVQQITAKFNQAVVKTTGNNNPTPEQQWLISSTNGNYIYNSNNSSSTPSLSSRHSTASPYPAPTSRVSPSPNVPPMKAVQTGAVISSAQTNMVLLNQQNSMNNATMAVANLTLADSLNMVRKIR